MKLESKLSMNGTQINLWFCFFCQKEKQVTSLSWKGRSSQLTSLHSHLPHNSSDTGLPAFLWRERVISRKPCHPCELKRFSNNTRHQVFLKYFISSEACWRLSSVVCIISSMSRLDYGMLGWDSRTTKPVSRLPGRDGGGGGHTLSVSCCSWQMWSWFFSRMWKSSTICVVSRMFYSDSGQASAMVKCYFYWTFCYTLIQNQI